MNFGVIGPGNIGEVIVRTLRDAGYPVKMANSRGPESLKDLGAKTGAIPVSLEQVVQDVDVLFLVVPQKGASAWRSARSTATWPARLTEIVDSSPRCAAISRGPRTRWSTRTAAAPSRRGHTY